MSIKLYPGVVLYSSNLNTALNQSPGLVNHLAMVVDNNNIVESQEDKGVILTPISEYKARAYQWNALYPINKQAGIKAAEFARTLLGRKYGKYSSIRPLLNEYTLRLNCVSVISLSYSSALNTKIKLGVPDDIFKYSNIFTGVPG